MRCQTLLLVNLVVDAVLIYRHSMVGLQMNETFVIKYPYIHFKYFHSYIIICNNSYNICTQKWKFRHSTLAKCVSLQMKTTSLKLKRVRIVWHMKWTLPSVTFARRRLHLQKHKQRKAKAKAKGNQRGMMK